MRVNNLFVLLLTLSTTFLSAAEKGPTEPMLKIMKQEKYRHSNWGLFVKDLQTGEALFSLNMDKMCLPASTTKMFSIAALLHAYGDNYRFKTPVYAMGSLKDGKLKGSLILVGQGDLTFGGRQDDLDHIAFTKLDHTNANQVPGAELTPQDPLQAFNALAKQIAQKGIKEISGSILIDDRLFQTTEQRGTILSPIFINENLIDIVVNPTEIGKLASLSSRPEVPGYTVTNRVTTVASDKPLDIQVTANDEGNEIVIEGSIPTDQKNVVRVSPIKNPSKFARAAMVQALKKQGIVVKLEEKTADLPPSSTFIEKQPIAVWSSPPLSEYAKLILKVSHNTGANLVPLLLAAQKGEATFDQGMIDLGNFVVSEVLVPSDSFVFADAAGGDSNRVTPKAEVQLLEYMKKQPAGQFQKFYNALPILGVDGSLADCGKNTPAAGKVFAKTGTGVTYNLALGRFFLTTQTLGGYIQGKNGNLYGFMISVNNAAMPTIQDVFPIFEDLCQIANIVYTSTND